MMLLNSFEMVKTKYGGVLQYPGEEPTTASPQQSGAGTTGARVRSTVGEDEGEAELKENALLAVGGITIPKRRKKSKSLSVTGKVG